MFGYTTPSETRDTVAYTVRRPLGVVAVITPWNFPLAIPSWKIAPALICGNVVVFKPASSTPLSAIKLMETFVEAGLPPGVLNLVTGPGGSVGDYMVKHPDVAGISFTGSTEIGAKAVLAGGGDAEEGAVRNGGQERGDCAGGRGHGAGGGVGGAGGLRVHRAAMHGDEVG